MSCEIKNLEFCNRDNLKVLGDKTMFLELDYRRRNDHFLIGSISHRFVDMVSNLSSQDDYYNVEMAEDEIVLLQVCQQ